MNKLKLKEYTPEYVIYFYQPEGQGISGEIIYRFNKEPETLTQAEKDEYGRYAFKACSKIKELIDDKKYLPLEITQAWY
ncbi:MAG: hypothetical protein LBS84_05070 [Clostridiales bacterium]|jgi:hypothetical protein|nr:hypothetical protein [Clostridiales bacterium]